MFLVMVTLKTLKIDIKSEKIQTFSTQEKNCADEQ